LYRVTPQGAKQSYICVADATGKLLERFEINNSLCDFILGPANQVLALAPEKTGSDHSARASPAVDEKPYMIIDLDAATVFRFGVPGEPHVFAKDLHRMICKRERIQDGRRYQSYVLVELPSLDERVVLPEEEFPPSDVTSQVRTTITLSVKRDDHAPTSFLRVSDTFDTAFWVKQRVEDDYFRYSIVRIDLDTGKRQVVVPESETPILSVITTGDEFRSPPVTLHRLTADGDGLLFGIGKQIHLYGISKQESVLVADNDSRVHYNTAHSRSGYRILRYGNVFDKSFDRLGEPRLKFAAVDVFHEGKPIRLFRGKNYIENSLWLDEERIIFHENQAIYSLNASGGSAQQVFPPAMPGGNR